MNEAQIAVYYSRWCETRSCQKASGAQDCMGEIFWSSGVCRLIPPIKSRHWWWWCPRSLREGGGAKHDSRVKKLQADLKMAGGVNDRAKFGSRNGSLVEGNELSTLRPPLEPGSNTLCKGCSAGKTTWRLRTGVWNWKQLVVLPRFKTSQSEEDRSHCDPALPLHSQKCKPQAILPAAPRQYFILSWEHCTTADCVRLKA